jgi:RNA polymerase sigma-70 factor (ECF subfamily)
MDEVGRVRRGEAVGGLAKDGEDLVGYPPLLEPGAQRHPVDELHDHAHLIALPADVVDGDDVGVRETSEGSSLTLEPERRGRVDGVEDLHREVSKELRIVDAVHDPHAASTELAEDVVAPEDRVPVADRFDLVARRERDELLAHLTAVEVLAERGGASIGRSSEEQRDVVVAQTGVSIVLHRRHVHFQATVPRVRLAGNWPAARLRFDSMTSGAPRLEEIVRRTGLADGPTAQAFDAYLRQRFAEDASARANEDLYLAFACASGSRSAKARLGELLMQTSAASRKVRIPEATVDDARQIVFERLAGSPSSPAKIESYDGRGPLGAFLRVTLVREALYLHRQRANTNIDGWVDELLDAATPDEDPEIAAMKRELRAECRAALERAARALGSRDRSLLRQHLVLGTTVDTLGPVYGVHRATVARWIVAAKDALFMQFCAELEATLGLRAVDAKAVIGLVQSRLDISVASLLETRDQ